MIEKNEVFQFRQPDHKVNTIFPQRWSPRAMSGEELGTEELMSLFEAARWAPSSNNNQSWRFLYARNETPHWETFFNLLTDTNKAWVKNAAAFILIVSKNTFDFNGKPSRTHSFDTGAAWENLALQGSLNGLVVHCMQGFDYERAKQELHVPDDYTVEAIIAVGRPGNPDDLPEFQRQREMPSSRKPVSEFAFEGFFPEQ